MIRTLHRVVHRLQIMENEHYTKKPTNQIKTHTPNVRMHLRKDFVKMQKKTKIAAKNNFQPKKKSGGTSSFEFLVGEQSPIIPIQKD